MNFNEARRFLRLDKPTAAIRMAATMSHRRVALRYEAEQRDNPDAYDLRTMKPPGNLTVRNCQRKFSTCIWKRSK